MIRCSNSIFISAVKSCCAMPNTKFNSGFFKFQIIKSRYEDKLGFHLKDNPKNELLKLLTP